MRMQPRTITLGEHLWQVRPLTCAQVQAIEPLLFAGETSGGRTGPGTVAAALAILKLALARDHAEAATGLDDIEAGASDIATALACVLRLGGFVPDERLPENAPGEADAGATPALPFDGSTGPLSTPG